MRDLKLLVLTVVAFIGIVACGGPAADNSAVKNGSTGTNAAPGSSPAASSTTAAVDPSEQLYADNCMICHKAKGIGGPLTMKGKKINPANLTSAKYKKESDDELYKDIAEGVPDEGMPSFKDKLKPAEIKTLVSHIRSMQN